jgi:hypothetical protein
LFSDTFVVANHSGIFQPYNLNTGEGFFYLLSGAVISEGPFPQLGYGEFTLKISPVPEPSIIVMVLIGVICGVFQAFRPSRFVHAIARS